MSLIRNLVGGLRALFRKDQAEREMDEELHAYLDAAVQEKMRTGMSHDEALRAARVEMGSLESVKEEIRSAGWEATVETLWQDVRYGLRQLRRSPGFTMVAVLTLALGIGANTTIFSLADALLFRPFPVADPGRLVGFMRLKVEAPIFYSSFSYPEYQDFREQTKVLSAIAAYSSVSVSMNLNGEASRVDGEIVSGNYFSLLGVKPSLGRTFLPEEDQAGGAHPVVVLSADFWQRRLNADRGVIGHSLTLNGHSFTVVGVAPVGFRGLAVGSSPAFWTTLAMHEQVMPSFTFEGRPLFYVRGCDWLDVVARLEPGRTVAEAAAEAKTLAAHQGATYPVERKGWTVVTSPLNDARLLPWNSDTTRLMGVLIGVVGVVLLIACSNVAGLLLARASTRRMEIGIRTGLGARRSRLVRQLLTESLMLSALGGAAALMLASVGIRVLTTFELPGMNMAALDLRVDWRVFVFTLILAALTAIIFGLLPAMQTTKVELVETLKGSSRTTGSRQPRLRQSLVVSQIALSFLLLVAAGLLLRTLRNILGTNLGYDPHNVLLTSVDLGLAGYTQPRARLFYQQTLERVEHSPGVRAACWASTAPLSGWHIAFDVVLEDGKPGRGQRINVDGNWVSPGFFTTLGVPIVAGRDFASRDREGTPPVAIVSESTARRVWPGENPLGQRFWLHKRGEQPSLEVVGVVKDGKYFNTWTKDSTPFVFLPFNQSFQSHGTLLIRGETGTGGLAASVRREVKAMDSDLPVFDTKTLSQQYGEGLLLQRMGAEMVGGFGALSLALAAVGIFGLISFSVGQRTHEIGVRMALGAQRQDMINLVLGQGLALTAAGLGVGLGGAVAVTRLLSSLLYGVKPGDPLTLTLAALIMAGVALLASYLPARRATKVDPMVALRYE